MGRRQVQVVVVGRQDERTFKLRQGNRRVWRSSGLRLQQRVSERHRRLIASFGSPKLFKSPCSAASQVEVISGASCPWPGT
jgi:hypothetical protein